MVRADYNDEDGGVILDGPFDPDAQATVTDYIDYTEYLPADLIRSLTLIRGLDERYLEATQNVHQLTKAWGQLPDLPPNERPDAQTLRRNISAQLDRAINARESAYAEACRLYDVVDRHFNRLDCIKQKLQALPKPAEPTPPPQTTSDNRRKTSKKGEAAPTTTRIKLRLDGPANAGARTAQRARSRRGVAAADRLAGLHPDNPIASTEHSDVEDEAKGAPTVAPEEPGAVKGKKEKQTRRSRTAGPISTNGHGHGPVISTSNALAMLKPPPEDAKPGSEDLPWLRLTEWEMTKLRKKMKKNAIWQPSEVMIHRELALRGRGWDAYRAAKAEAEANGTEFLDCDDIMNTYVPGMLTRLSDANGLEGVVETKLSNRGMKLNEAKKLKRENMAREQAAAAAAAADVESKRRSQLGSTDAAGQQASVAAGKLSRASKRRRMDEIAVRPLDTETRGSLRSSTKRRRMNKEISGPAGRGASSEPADTATATTETEIRKPSPVPSTASTAAARFKEGKTSTPPVSRPPSRHLAPGAPTEVAGRDLRRKSATPARKTPVPEGTRATSVSAPARRRKRPAPGPVSSGRDGGAAVSYGRRKAKPTKKRIGPREQAPKDGIREDIRIDEDGVLEEIDPHEPRYCLCGDVSFGTMICCENPDCDREWFHLECVGLSEVPSRTAKWYCPDCRVKFNKGTDGIVKLSHR